MSWGVQTLWKGRVSFWEVNLVGRQGKEGLRGDDEYYWSSRKSPHERRKICGRVSVPHYIPTMQTLSFLWVRKPSLMSSGTLGGIIQTRLWSKWSLWFCIIMLPCYVQPGRTKEGWRCSVNFPTSRVTNIHVNVYLYELSSRSYRPGMLQWVACGG